MYILELYHHGIQGQRWGVRRFQNADGSLKPAGKKRYANGPVDVPHTEVVGGGGGAVEEEENKKTDLEDWEKELYDSISDVIEANPGMDPTKIVEGMISGGGFNDFRYSIGEHTGIDPESITPAQGKKMLAKALNHYSNKKKIDEAVNSDMYKDLDDTYDRLKKEKGYKSKMDMIKSFTDGNELVVTLAEFGGVDASNLSDKELDRIRKRMEKHYSTTGNNIKHSIDASGNILKHHGILGQRWGVRRFQNADGSLTKAGEKRYSNMSESAKQRYGISKGSSSSGEKSPAELNKEFEDEAKRLQTRLNYAKNLREYSDLTDPGKMELERLRRESEIMTYRYNIANKQSELKKLEPKPKSKLQKLKETKDTLETCVGIGKQLYEGYGVVKNYQSAYNEIKNHFGEKSKSESSQKSSKSATKATIKDSRFNRKEKRSKKNSDAYKSGFEYAKKSFDKNSGDFYFDPGYFGGGNTPRLKG